MTECNMATSKKTHKVTLYQKGKDVTFRLNDKEYNELKGYADTWNSNFMYNFSAFAWADNTLSRPKCGRFYANFNYHDGDFYFFEEN